MGRAQKSSSLAIPRIHPHIRHGLAKTPLELVRAQSEMRRAFSQIAPGHFTSLSKADDLENVLGPGSSAPFLPRAAHQRMEAHSLAHV